MPAIAIAATTINTRRMPLDPIAVPQSKEPTATRPTTRTAPAGSARPPSIGRINTGKSGRIASSITVIVAMNVQLEMVSLRARNHSATGPKIARPSDSFDSPTERYASPMSPIAPLGLRPRLMPMNPGVNFIRSGTEIWTNRKTPTVFAAIRFGINVWNAPIRKPPMTAPPIAPMPPTTASIVTDIELRSS